MRPILHVFACAALVLLVACSTGKPVRLFPPTASIQQLQVQADGSWEVSLRLQNFSNVGMRIAALDAQLHIQQRPSARIAEAPDFVVPASSVEVLRVQLVPDAAARSAVAAALADRGSIGYQLSGTITSTEPDRREDEFEFSSALAPVPGLPDTLR